MSNLEEMSERALDELARFITGDKIGYGMSRAVYELAHDKTKVIKIEQRSGHFQNIIEWETWWALKDTKYSKWLAPCHYISPCGIFLIMERTLPMRENEKPKALPAWLRDHKMENFGILGVPGTLGERIVCHDYGTNLLLNHGAFGAKMKKTDF